LTTAQLTWLEIVSRFSQTFMERGKFYCEATLKAKLKA
jgi:hypothetical protein